MVALLSVLSSVRFHSLIGRVLIKKSRISGLNMKFVPLFFCRFLHSSFWVLFFIVCVEIYSLILGFN